MARLDRAASFSIMLMRVARSSRAMTLKGQCRISMIMHVGINLKKSLWLDLSLK
jgi:hypothetical protein